MEAVASASEQDAVPVQSPMDAPASAAERLGANLHELPQLSAGEEFLAGPVSAVFTRVSDDGRTSSAVAGLLYVTNHRLIEAGDVERRIDLRRITELGLTAGRILVTIARSRGLVVEVEDAHDLRALIAEAVSNRRRPRPSALVPVMARRFGTVADAELVEDVADVAAHGTR